MNMIRCLFFKFPTRHADILLQALCASSYVGTLYGVGGQGLQDRETTRIHVLSRPHWPCIPPGQLAICHYSRSCVSGLGRAEKSRHQANGVLFA